jgi:anti-sigma B factor antagonist
MDEEREVITWGGAMPCPGGIMQSQATTRQAGNIAIVDFSGSIDAALLHKTIQELVATGQHKVLLNIEHVTYVDSAGMGELVGSCSTLRQLGGDLKLASPQARITNLLQMTKLSTVLAIFSNEQEALKSF